MNEHIQVMDSVIATPRASSNGSIFWVTPTQFNPQTGTYQTHYYSDDLVKSGTVSVGTPTLKNNSMIQQNASKSYSGVSKSVAAPILIPPPTQGRNVGNYDEPIVRIPDGIRELEYEDDDDDQSVVDIKRLSKSYDYDSENGDNSNRAKNVVDAVVALGRVLVKDLQKAVPNISRSGSKIFDNCLAGSNNLDNELTFSPRNILRDTLKDNGNNIRPHLLPNGLTLQELPKSSINKNMNIVNLSSSTLLCSDLFFDQNKYPKLTLVSYDSSNTKTNGLIFEDETISRLNKDFSDLPLCIISLVDCKNELFSKLLLTPDLEYNTNLDSHLVNNNDTRQIQKRISLVDLYYWYKDEEFIYLLLDVKASVIPKLHDVLMLFSNSISSCVIMNNNGIINQESLNKLSLVCELQKKFEKRHDEIITKLLKTNENKENDAINGEYNTPKRSGELVNDIKNNSIEESADLRYSTQRNPLLLLTPRYKPTLNFESNSNSNKSISDNSETTIDKDKCGKKNIVRNLLCTLKTTPRPYFIWMLHDFNYILYDKTNNMIWNSIDYFETLLNELGCGYDCDKTKIGYYENLKLYIRSYYTMKECHTLVSPYNENNNVNSMLRVDHLKQVSCFRQRLLGISKNHALSYKIGQYNSSSSIKRFIGIYVSVLEEMISSEISEINEAVQKKFCDKILDDIDSYYVNENKKLVDMFPMNENLLKERIVEIKIRCLHLYKEYTSKYIDTDIYIDYKIKLQNNLQKKEKETFIENSRISVKYCNTYLKEISDKTILNKFKSNNVRSRSDIGFSDLNDDRSSKTPYLILDLEKDLDELCNIMLTSLSDKIPKEISLNCFLELANKLRHEWYSINKIKNNGKIQNNDVFMGGRISIENCFGGKSSSISGGGIGMSMKLSHNMDDELLRKVETPEMLVNRLSSNLEEVDSEYNCYTVMQKKELLEDILLEALKKKDRLGDFYDEDKLHNLDSLITMVQDKLDVVNLERKSILDNDEIQRQMILKQKRKNWRRIFSCFKKNNELENMRYNHDNNGGNIDDYNVTHSVNNHNDMY
ncbi:hypothetical protein FG386_002839 [Cryptosporidium ryanae]|uniref:uncharacterized protein n=1 Tax=Cryptosporidium ryanae TaxID=515981 RepID=UPI00351A6C24|nr:hypothetical protein FG386_002839 [Cryptosporidium ryanae]